MQLELARLVNCRNRKQVKLLAIFFKSCLYVGDGSRFEERADAF